MNISFPRTLELHEHGVMDYLDALQLQRELHQGRVKDTVKDNLLLLEHPPVFTMGKHARDTDILVSSKRLEAEGITVHKIERGGLITYHGPGQLVGYIIVHLGVQCKRIRQFIRQIEESIIVCLKQCYDIDAKRDLSYPGVWVGGEKIAAVGVSISERVSMHGFALNVQPNLQYFQLIVPCGIKNRSITSVERLLGHKVDMNELKSAFGNIFADTFGYTQTDRTIEHYSAAGW